MKTNSQIINKPQSQLIAGAREDFRTGQYFPTINGIDTSPTSFDEKRAIAIAEEQITLQREPAASTDVFKNRATVTSR
jgi:hypothetical protein